MYLMRWDKKKALMESQTNSLLKYTLITKKKGKEEKAQQLWMMKKQISEPIWPNNGPNPS